MVNLQGHIKKIKVTQEKVNGKGDILKERQVEVTIEAEYSDITDAEYANLALAQANGDLVDITFDPRQLVMDFSDTLTPAEDNA